MKNIHTSRARQLPQRQRGLALLVALLVLVAMSIAGIALIRSVDTASLLAGNIAFRQGASLAGDAGVEAARTYLLSAGSKLEADDTDSGYYATRAAGIDWTGVGTPDDSTDNVKWPGTSGTRLSPKCLAADAAGNTVCYVINRLCDATGPLDSKKCSTRKTAQGGGSVGVAQAQITYSNQAISSSATAAYYSITVRSAGPRNNFSFLQAYLII